MHAKPLPLFVLCLTSLATVAHASKKNALPDACGADEVEFKLTPASGTPLTTAIPEGKARLVFLESYDKPGSFKTGVIGGGPKIMTRFGMDGAWVGAAGGNNYFVVDVTPGEHKLCTSVKGEKKFIGMDTVTTEAGQTYYYEARYDADTATTYSTGFGASSTGKTTTITPSYQVLKTDEAKFRIKSAAPVTSEPKN